MTHIKENSISFSETFKTYTKVFERNHKTILVFNDLYLQTINHNFDLQALNAMLRFLEEFRDVSEGSFFKTIYDELLGLKKSKVTLGKLDKVAFEKSAMYCNLD